MIIIPSLLLISLGVAVIFTSDSNLAIQQAIFAIIGIAGYFLISNFDYKLTKQLIKPLYFITLIFLVIVFIIGIETRGSVRWISLGPFNLQPSEFAKIVLVVTLANFWSSNLPSWKNIGKSLLIFLPLGALIFRQPDLGTTLTLAFIWFVILISANISFLKLFLMSILGATFIPIIWHFLKDYQKQRIESFVYPAQDPLGIGYNVIQSTIAVGSGQLLGRGLGRGTQSRLQFLPEFRTDFIFAFITEELGFLGSLIVLSLYSVIFYLLFKTLFSVKDQFAELIIIGVTSMIFFQILVNIGMNIGVLPITGITLPLLSYGGSSIVTVLLSFGLIASVAKYGLKRKEIDRFGFAQG